MGPQMWEKMTFQISNSAIRNRSDPKFLAVRNVLLTDSVKDPYGNQIPHSNARKFGGSK